VIGCGLISNLSGANKMKQTVNNTDFHSAFGYMDRLNNFTYEGRNALFEYLEQLEEDTGVEYELDVIALCCEYSQDTWQNVADNYNIDLLPDEEYEDYTLEQVWEARQKIVKDYLEENTIVIDSFDDGTILYIVF
jgi:hypothetical protein